MKIMKVSGAERRLVGNPLASPRPQLYAHPGPSRSLDRELLNVLVYLDQAPFMPVINMTFPDLCHYFNDKLYDNLILMRQMIVPGP